MKRNLQFVTKRLERKDTRKHLDLKASPSVCERVTVCAFARVYNNEIAMKTLEEIFFNVCLVLEQRISSSTPCFHDDNVMLFFSLTGELKR